MHEPLDVGQRVHQVGRKSTVADWTRIVLPPTRHDRDVRYASTRCIYLQRAGHRLTGFKGNDGVDRTSKWEAQSAGAGARFQNGRLGAIHGSYKVDNVLIGTLARTKAVDASSVRIRLCRPLRIGEPQRLAARRVLHVSPAIA